MRRKALVSASSLAALLVLWHLGSLENPSMFPPPASVFELAIEVAQQPDHQGDTGLDHLGVTFYRIFIITAITLVVSVVLGILMGTRQSVERPLAAILPIWLTIPSVVVVLFAMILFDFSTLSVLVAVSFVAIPYGIVNTYQGAKDVNSNLMEMASVFELQQTTVWKDIYVPSLLPYLFASSRYLLGMIWKIVLLAETFGVSNGVGSMIRFWYNQGEIAHLLAYFTLFAITVLAIEYLILAPAERRAFSYRDMH